MIDRPRHILSLHNAEIVTSAAAAAAKHSVLRLLIYFKKTIALILNCYYIRWVDKIYTPKKPPKMGGRKEKEKIMPKLQVLFDATTSNRFPVYAQYAGQSYPQPAYLTLDIRSGELDADYSGEIGNAVPVSVWNDITLRFALMSETTADQIAEIIERNAAMFQEILDGSEVKWNGNNNVGKFTKHAQSLRDLIDEQRLFVCESTGGMLDLFDNFLEFKPFPSVGQSIEEFAQDIIDLDGESGFYFLVPYCLDSLLSDLRDQWAEMLYRGLALPVIVAQHLIEHGTCDDSLWVEELTEFASAE
ncbi:MAG: hypothetical protein ACRC1W_00235 [Shewanella sp.]